MKVKNINLELDNHNFLKKRQFANKLHKRKSQQYCLLKDCGHFKMKTLYIKYPGKDH